MGFMFSKIFISWKKDYGEKVALKVLSILRQYGIAYAFDEPKDCDLAILIGGDGTLMKHQSSLECPILGINPGKSVGHYMTMSNGDFERKLRKVIDGEEGKDFFIRAYPRLEASINRTPLPFLALNEVLISPIYVRRTFDSELTAGSRKTKERNSGILVYTPDGSYAYAGSAGAKPLKTETKFGVAAIAPYWGRLKKGEITLKDGCATVKCLTDEGELCVDGQEEQVCRLKENDVVSVKRSRKPARIFCFTGHKKA